MRNKKGQFVNGEPNWNKGKKCPQMSKALIGHTVSEESRNKMRLAKLGKKHTEEHKRKVGLTSMGRIPWNKGKKMPTVSGRNHWKWKGEGGLKEINHRIRDSLEIKLWRKAVFQRDNYTCQKTGKRGGILEAHHILNFSRYPELRFAIDNGITLSKESHKEFHRIYGKYKNTKEQLIEFLLK